VPQPFPVGWTGHVTDSRILDQRATLDTRILDQRATLDTRGRRRRGKARQAHRLPERKQGQETAGRRKDRILKKLHRCAVRADFREPPNSAGSALIL
jgi:hypothetical protein